jgi:rhodanese-related sulfurtransferase
MRAKSISAWVAASAVIAAFAAGLPVAAGSFPTVTPAQVAEWQERGESFLFVDTRPQAVFDVKHARGAFNIPAFAMGMKSLPRGAKVVLYDNGAGSAEAETAAKALQAKGQPEFYVMEGGLTAWEGQNLPIVVPPGESKAPLVGTIAAEDLLRLIDAKEKVVILDLRAPDVYRQSRVPGAVSTSTEAAMRAAVAGLGPSDLVVVYDDGSGGAREKAETLRRAGLRSAKYLNGGMLVWYEKNLRVER